MRQFSKISIAIDNAHTTPQRALNCRPGLGGLNQVDEHINSEYVRIPFNYINTLEHSPPPLTLWGFRVFCFRLQDPFLNNYDYTIPQ